MRELLELIENVSPDDSDKLDEIDRDAWLFLNHQRVCEVSWNGQYVSYTPCDENQTFDIYLAPLVAPKYTRSRDALKAIRPEGWQLRIHESTSHGKPEWFCIMANGVTHTKLQLTPTEELAELHAIIQAIEWERAQ